MKIVLALVLLGAGMTCGCGYKVGGQPDLLPATLKIIAIPAFANNTPRYRLTESLPNAIGREFLSRTRYRVVTDMNEADAILRGTIRNYMSYPTIFDQATGRAAGIQLSIFLDLKLVERTTGKVLYERQNMEIRGRYEVAVDQTQYFDESTEALRRVSAEVGRQVVSSVLEAF
ncbi:MAG: hypothetical protein HY821_07600 [Acidobacteria bacterium]|nr:hypothetical protein [Acidobacteriota bacterium]